MTGESGTYSGTGPREMKASMTYPLPSPASFCRSGQAKDRPRAVGQARVAKEIPGVILRVDGRHADVKLGESVFAIPKAVFADRSIIASGQHILYRIVIDGGGFRRQQIVADTSIPPADISDLLEILKII